MRSESEWKTWFAGALRREGHYARRIEDQFSVGFPDLVIGARSFSPAFVEVKLVSSGHYDPRPRQYIELVQLHRPPLSYGIVMGVEDGEMYHFSEPVKRVILNNPNTYHHVNPVTGLVMFLDHLRRKYHE